MQYVSLQGRMYKYDNNYKLNTKTSVTTGKLQLVGLQNYKILYLQYKNNNNNNRIISSYRPVETRRFSTVF